MSARVAQWLEHHIDIVGAEGSIPSARTSIPSSINSDLTQCKHLAGKQRSSYSSAMQKEITVTLEQAGQRLDILCASLAPHVSRSAIQKAIKTGQITVNGRVVKPGHAVQPGAVVSLTVPDDTAETAAVSTHSPTPAIAILFEDRDMVVINKPAGIAVHPGQGQAGQTIAHWFAARYPDSRGVGEDQGRAGIVHRLDKDTSGVLLLTKTPKAYEYFLDQFARRRAHKEYLALVFGAPGGTKGRINQPLKRSARYPLRRTIDPTGKEAITEWRIEKKYGDDFALLRLFPLTGRMHQLRAHLHFLGYPIVGDSLYTYRKQRPPHGVKRQLLHAEKLGVTMLNGNKRVFTAPLPEDFQTVLNSLLPE